MQEEIAFFFFSVGELEEVATQICLLSKATLHTSPLGKFLLDFLSKPVEWRHGVKKKNVSLQ